MMALFDASNIVFGIFDLIIIFLDTFHVEENFDHNDIPKPIGFSLKLKLQKMLTNN